MVKGILTRLKLALAKPFTPLTLDEIRIQKLEALNRELMQSQHVILTHRFQEHMTKATIQALHDWDRVKLTGENKCE